MTDIVIRVTNLSKCYAIYDNPRDRLKQFLTHRPQLMLGRTPKQYYREFWALKDVSFEIKKGETVGIIGRNGSGKSTLLQIICGTLSPTSGSVETRGRIAALLELGSGFNSEFTGRENVYMNAAVLGLSKEEVDSRFDDIAAFADIGQFIEQPVKTYSSGMVVRLAFAVIAHVDADLLIIDEALSVGDAFFVQKCMRFLRKFMIDRTVLFVSHDTNAVLNLCSSAILLKNGLVSCSGVPKGVTEIYLKESYEEQQGVSAVETQESDEAAQAKISEAEQQDYRDMRLDFINSSPLRNDIEMFQFREDAASFGKGLATITSVAFYDEKGSPLAWVVGGENVSLRIRFRAHDSLHSPIIGFLVKDRLGQYLFGDNTFLTYQENPLSLVAGEEIEARFDFRMPILAPGDYSVCVAVAEGTQTVHVQHQWIHDALIFKAHTSSVSTGLIGIPMKRITMAKAIAGTNV